MDTFKERVLEALRRLFSSTKFYTFLTGVIVALGLRYGINLDPELVLAILGLAGLLIGAQGAQDFGKEAKKIEAATPKPPDRVQQTVNVDTTTAPPESAEK